MERGFAHVAGLAALALMVARLGRLLQSDPGQLDWQMILLASAVLGGVVWWLASQLVRSSRRALFVFTAAGIILFLRVSVPETLILGFLPGPETAVAWIAEMQEAVSWIRFGIPPIVPAGGVVAGLAGILFVIGGLYSWGATSGPVAAMVLPSLVLYLQFAVFDRTPAGLGWLLATGTALALGVAATAVETRRETGRARDERGNALPRRSVALGIVTAGLVGMAAVAVASTAGGLIPEYRVGQGGPGAGDLFVGGGSFDRWVDLRQSVLNPTNEVVFVATLDSEAPPVAEIYWRMETLDVFDGTEWRRSDETGLVYNPDQPLGNIADRYQGTTTEVLQRVRINTLRTGAGIAPTAGVPIEIRAIAGSQGALSPTEFEVLSDSAIAYSPTFSAGDTYEVVAVHPELSADLGALATTPEGVLSPMFAAAAAEGQWVETAEIREGNVVEPPDLAAYRQLPEDLPTSLGEIANQQTAGASSDLERAWMLQHWFRESGDFTYSSDVSTGHDSLDLAAWLTEPTSINFRSGYCEQFAASMAVLARTLGIESRVVWGFTPGTSGESGQVIVRDTNAHAWVELWIDGFGWVPFEPTPRSGFVPASMTASFEPADFVESPALAPTSPDLALADAPSTNQDNQALNLRINPWWIVVSAILGLLAAIPLVKWFRRMRRFRRVREGSVAAAWDEIVDRLTDLGETVQASLTPLELARDNGEALVPIATRYSEELYGARSGLARESDLREAEEWLASQYGTFRRTRARMSPKSLARR